MLNKLPYRRGFTLIELLVVVAIIGILASVILASLNLAREKGRDARRQADLSSIQLAIEVYFDAGGVYPATDGWISSVAPGALHEALVPTFMSHIPDDPPGNTASHYMYYIVPGTSNTQYCLYAELESIDDVDPSFTNAPYKPGTTLNNYYNMNYALCNQ